MYIGLLITTLVAAVLANAAERPASTTCFSTMGFSLVQSPPTYFETIFLTATKTEVRDTQATTIVQMQANKLDVSSLCHTTTKTSTHTVTVKSTSTKTVPTPSGFLPVSSTLPQSSLPLSSQGKHKVGNPRTSNVRRTSERTSPRPAAPSKPKYPQKVDCKVYETVTSTATSMTAVAPQTLFIGASVEAKTTKTRTVTVTKTHTDIIPGPTIHNTCLAPNQETYPGTDYVFFTPDGNSDFLITTGNINSSYDCCVACVTQFNCTVGLYGGADAEISSCLFLANFNAGPQSKSTYIIDYTDSYYSDDNPAPIFNGQCGKYTSAEYEAID